MRFRSKISLSDSATLGSMLDIAFVLIVITALLVVVGLCQPLAAYLKLPPPVLLGVVGLALGGFPALVTHLGWSGETDALAEAFVDLPVSSGTFIYVFLPLLVFEAGIATDVRRMLEDTAPILLLAIVATLISTAVVGLALWPFGRVSLVVCLLLGSVVSTTDPAAVIAIFRDIGAPARLTRLVEGEALLNDAGALLAVIPWVRDDRLAEATLTLALAYGVFVVAERLLHVSGVVAVLAAALTISALGRSRIAPYNWSFMTDLWDQIAFWARSLIFILASILVPKLLGDFDTRDLLLLAVLTAAAFAARAVVLFVLMPLLERVKLTQPISSAYKYAIIWGGLRGALTLVLALGVTENAALDQHAQRFVTVLATGFVLFTLFVNGTTLRLVIAMLGLHRLSPRNQVLRDRVLAVAYAEVADSVRHMGQYHGLAQSSVEQVVEPYQTWIAAADARDEAERLPERERLAIALVALGNQERVLVLETRADQVASQATVQVLLRNADALVEGARSEGRLGYQRAAEGTLSFPPAFRIAYYLYRHFGIQRFVADRLADRVELLLMTRLLVERLISFNDERLSAVFQEERLTDIAREIIEHRRDEVGDALDALRRQYPDYVAALEERVLRQSALRQEMGRYQALFEEGLIPQELYDDLKRGTSGTRAAPRPRFEIGLDTHRLIERLDILSGLDEQQLERVARLLRPRFTVPNERIIRRGDRGDAVFFIASGAVEVRLPARRVRLGSGEFFGEMALLSGRPRQADVFALTYCRLLVLRKADFERFLAANPERRAEINRIAKARLSVNHEDGDRAAESVSN
ncbi:MAG: cyclic nucleotide-binding domain-containing protein [Alphaproteobacteria bacterium]|nr:MAG: cyclic nucleotide-binding domain-containing protein [Alphaproteobacteria bacterium]